MLITSLPRRRHLKGRDHQTFVRNSRSQTRSRLKWTENVLYFPTRSLAQGVLGWGLTEGIVNEERRIENEEEEEEGCRMRPERKKSASSSSAIRLTHQKRQKRSEGCTGTVVWYTSAALRVSVNTAALPNLLFFMHSPRSFMRWAQWPPSSTPFDTSGCYLTLLFKVRVGNVTGVCFFFI